MTTIEVSVHVHQEGIRETAALIREQPATEAFTKEFWEALASLMESAVEHEPIWTKGSPNGFYCMRCGFGPEPCDVWMNVSLMVASYQKEQQKSGDAASPDHRGAEGREDGSGTGPDGGDPPGEPT